MIGVMGKQTFLFCGLFLALAACETLPGLGPSSRAIEGSAGQTFAADDSDVTRFQLIDVSPAQMPKLNKRYSQFPSDLVSQGYLGSNERVSVSYKISVTIWEAAYEGLFATQGNRQTTLQAIVSNQGTIEVPYAGSLNVVGKILRLRSEIVALPIEN